MEKKDVVVQRGGGRARAKRRQHGEIGARERQIGMLAKPHEVAGDDYCADEQQSENVGKLAPDLEAVGRATKKDQNGLKSRIVKVRP